MTEVKPPDNVLLAGVVGSTAYGLAREGSDIDRLGCYAEPTSRFHGLHPPAAQDKTWVTKNPDANYHEAGKLASLCLAANPAATELLWLNGYETLTPLGEQIVGIRLSLLSADAVCRAYLRYAEQQVRRIRNRGHGPSCDLCADRERNAKHARHVRRLLYQGVELHRTGLLPVLLPPETARLCRDFGDAVADGSIRLAEAVLADAAEAFGRPGALPGRPDEAAAERWLQDVRRAYWTDRP